MTSRLVPTVGGRGTYPVELRDFPGYAESNADGECDHVYLVAHGSVEFAVWVDHDDPAQTADGHRYIVHRLPARRRQPRPVLRTNDPEELLTFLRTDPDRGIEMATAAGGRGTYPKVLQTFPEFNDTSWGNDAADSIMLRARGGKPFWIFVAETYAEEREWDDMPRFAASQLDERGVDTWSDHEAIDDEPTFSTDDPAALVRWLEGTEEDAS